jgi:O-antigen ligase
MLRLPGRAVSIRGGLNRSHAIATVAIIVAIGVILVVPAPLNLGFFVGPAAVLAVLSHPILLPLGMIASVPVQDAVPVPDSVPVTATRAMTGLAAILLPFLLIRRRPSLPHLGLPLLTIALMIVMILSLWNATDLGAGYAELYRWLVALFSLILILMCIRTRNQVLIAVGLISLLAIIQGGLGLYQSLTGAGPASFQVSSAFSRSFGTFGMPNSFAAYMEMVALPLVPIAVWTGARLVSRFRNYRDRRLRGFARSSQERKAFIGSLLLFALIASGTVVGLASVVASFSRGGWLGTIAALGIMVILLGRRATFTAMSVVGITAFVLLIGASGAVLSTIGDRFSQIADQARIGDVSGVPITDENFATVERLSHWQTAVRMWDEHPWLGVGAGNYNERFTEFAVHPQFNESQGHAHNYYLHMLAETGLTGLLVYFAFLVATVYVGWRAYRSDDELARAIGIGAIAISVAIIIHNLFENLHVLNISMQMMLVWGLAIIVGSWSSTQREEGNG